MRLFVIIILASQIIRCQNNTVKTEFDIVSFDDQKRLYQNLIDVVNSNFVENSAKDTVAFLILPLEESCPSCRDKTIDSILKYQSNLNDHRFIVLSSKSGRKSMSSYFRKRNQGIPNLRNQIFLDSTNMLGQNKMFDRNPSFYYVTKRKVYKKVMSLPSTIKQDLKNFFSTSHATK